MFYYIMEGLLELNVIFNEWLFIMALFQGWPDLALLGCRL